MIIKHNISVSPYGEIENFSLSIWRDWNVKFDHDIIIRMKAGVENSNVRLCKRITLYQIYLWHLSTQLLLPTWWSAGMSCSGCVGSVQSCGSSGSSESSESCGTGLCGTPLSSSSPWGTPHCPSGLISDPNNQLCAINTPSWPHFT